MSLHKYIRDSEKTYNYRIKTVVELDDDAMDRLERVILKHCPVDISRPRKTIIQNNPLDFPTIETAEVYIVDVELGIPASSYVLHRQICELLQINGDMLIVRGENDPHEIENQLVAARNDMDEEAKAEGKERMGVLMDPNYTDGEDAQELTGNEYNRKFLSYLRTAQEQTPTEKKIDAPHPLSVWKEQPVPEMDNGAFNDHIEGAPTIGKAGDQPDVATSPYGNLTDTKRTYKRQYGKNGTLSVLRKEADTRKLPK